MRSRLFFAFFFAIIVTVLILGYAIQQNSLRELNNFVRRGGIVGVDGIVKNLEAHYAKTHSLEDAEKYLVFSKQNSGGGNPGGGPEGSKLILADADGTIIGDAGNKTQVPNEILENSIALKENNNIIGYLVPERGEFGLNSRYADTLSSRLTEAALRTLAITGSIALGLSVLLGYFMLRPIRQLTAAATKMAEGDLSQRVDIKGRDEFSRLGRTFNYMAESLEEAKHMRNAMTADIAHELRTPLAIQRANLEALQDSVYDLTLDNLEPIYDQNKQLTHLVEDLQLLALTDADALKLEILPTDINNLVNQVIEQTKPQAKQLDIALIVTSENKDVVINADSRRLEQILNNIFQNALHYTPSGGEIKVEISEKDQNLLIAIGDSGPGISEEALPHLFDRFYRADPARDRHQGGSGLGLTIAKQLTKAQGGDLSVKNKDGGGAEFTLILPL
ncbi:MAG: ATP-binding protein [Chloroflexota bacterium]